MKINYIKYHNYRCFKDVTIRFDTTEQKNISLVILLIINLNMVLFLIKK